MTVEHILPFNPQAEWCDDFGENGPLFHQRIGNMALVTKKENAALGQKPYAEKKELLLKTSFALNKNIEDYDEWNSQTIESRQKKLAKIALSLWRID